MKVTSAIAVAIGCGVLMTTGASPASAGEVTGNGDPTGMRGHAKSECGFSGLEDIAESPLRTQTPHKVWFNAQVGVIYPDPGAPGTACNPAKSSALRR